MQIFDADGQMCMFDPDGYAGRMFRAPSAQGHRNMRTSGSSSRRSSELKAIPFMSLDLTPGHGNLLGEFYWELISPWRGGSTMLNTGPAPLREEDVYSLSRILQAAPPRRYYLSRIACLGILRRARERGKELPEQLKTALMAQAGIVETEIPSEQDTPVGFDGYNGDLTGEVSATLGVNCGMSTGRNGVLRATAFAANQRDEVRDLHDVAGALGAQPGMKQQTFVAEGCLTPWDTQQQRVFTPEGKALTLAGADGGGGRNPAALSSGGGQAGQGYPCVFTAGFCAGAAPTAGGIGWQEECSPTLKAAESGTNMVPSILCLNDQGGGVMDCSIDVSGTLRAQEHGHQPLVMAEDPLLFENHGIDSRYTGPHKVSPTMSARYGTGGNNVPLIAQDAETFCITGNAIDRQPQNGGNGIGYQRDIAYTLTATDHHAVYSRQRVDVFKDDDVASTESARQHKDATDLVCQPAYQETVGALTSSDRKGPNSQYVSQDKCVVEGPLLIRRLTPLECERLQGFPDGWTDLPGASDSARYKALGNSVAIPCVEHVLRGIALASGATA